MEEEKKRRLVTSALAFTDGSCYEADTDERYLLEQFVLGKLSIDEVIMLWQAAKSDL